MKSSAKSSPLLSFSPELQRNLWLELSPGRLIGMVLVVGLLGGITDQVFGARFVYGTLGSILWILLILWGPLLAAETIFDEIASHTWDVQRLSAQRASGLILGKLVGGTLYAWFGAALCIAGILYFAPDHASDVYNRVLEGILAQSMAMFAALVIARFGNGRSRGVAKLGAWFTGIMFAGFFSTMLGLAAGDITPPGAITVDPAVTHWYGMTIATRNFWYAVEIVSIGWIIFGTIRLMRRQLGYHDGPLGWGLFVISMMVFAGGSTAPPKLAADNTASWQGRMFVAAHLLTYVALLGLPVAIGTSRKLSAAFKNRNWHAAWPSTAPWMVAAGLMIIGAILYAATSAAHAMGAIALIGFVMRDAIVVYGCRTRFTRRSEAVLVLYFSIVYLFATLVITIGYHPVTSATQALFLQIFSPFSEHDIGIGALFPWGEAALAYVLFRKDFAKTTR